MADSIQTFQRTSQVAEENEEMSASDSDSDEEVAMLKNLSLQGFDPIVEPVTGTGFIYHDKMAEHKCEWDHGYPENPQRLIQPLKRCTELGLVQRCQRLQIRYATEDEITTKHTRDHVEIAQSTVGMSMEELMALCEKYDAWYANKVTYEASLIAAGSTISMVEHIIQDKISNGFAMVRPPGHHAMEQEFNGYCTFNNVALAAQFALNSGIHRILIVDWDVHHGQGTQRMFYDDPRVLYFSIHRYEHGTFWPQLRESDYDYIGTGSGQGFNINVPLNKTGMTDSDYMAVFQMILLPVAYEFQPQLILISSGYDAAVGCPEGEMLITPAMYANMTHQLMGLAAGRVCVVLEGGYCLKSLAEGCALTLRSLLRDPCPALPKCSEPSDSMMTTILNLIKILRKFWNCFKHYETLEDSETCPFVDVNKMPPVPDVTFSTPENKPEKYQIMNCYPVQDEKTRVHLSDLISKLIAETNLSKAEYKCCYVFDSEMRSHKNLHDKSHPERPERISKIYNSLAEWNLLKKCLTVASRLARKSELLPIHGENYLNELLQSQSKADEELKVFPEQHRYTSTYLHQKTVHCALLSCGSLLNVVEAVLRGKSQSGVAIIRPPGHHAECNKAMGFCFINNVAVAAKFAQTHFGIKRILIIDWDVHHGNATQHQFYNDPSVLYISLHRYDNGNFFPGSSDADLNCVGFGLGEGYNVNIPWSNSRMGDGDYLTAFTQIVMPIAYQYAPELVLVSAGFDCASGDPLGGYHVSPACFGHMTHMLMGLANGKVVLSLEGGYNLNSLSHSMATCTAALLGYPCPMLKPVAPCERAAEIIRDVLEIQKKYWTSLKGNVRIPSVSQSEKDVWAITKGQSNRKLRSRRSGASKSAHEQTTRPYSAGSSLKRSVVASSSDSSVTATTTSYTTTKSATSASTEAHTTVETSTPTGQSTTKSMKDEETIHSSEQSTSETEQLVNESASPDTSSANNNAGLFNRNMSNIDNENAGTKNTSDNSLPQNADVPSVPHFNQLEQIVSVHEDKEFSVTQGQEVASVSAQLISEMQGLTIYDSNAVSHAETVGRNNTSELTDNVVPGDSIESNSLSVSTVGTKSTDGNSKMQEASEIEHDSSKGTGDASVTKLRSEESSPYIFRSLVYGDEPDPEPLSIFHGNPLMASQEECLIAKEKNRAQLVASGKFKTKENKAIPSEVMSNKDETRPVTTTSGQDTRSGDAGNNLPESSRATGDESQLVGACGGSSRPTTVQDFLKVQGFHEIHAIQPLPWCPHLTEVAPLPQRGINPHDPCRTCGDVSENWVCLTCYAVECSRFVNEHMLMHKLETGHNMTLSYSDLSVWCYECDQYVDNDVLFSIKNAAHHIKFGEYIA